jgi:hypothetical protein
MLGDEDVAKTDEVDAVEDEKRLEITLAVDEEVAVVFEAPGGNVNNDDMRHSTDSQRKKKKKKKKLKNVKDRRKKNDFLK